MIWVFTIFQMSSRMRPAAKPSTNRWSAKSCTLMVPSGFTGPRKTVNDAGVAICTTVYRAGATELIATVPIYFARNLPDHCIDAHSARRTSSGSLATRMVRRNAPMRSTGWRRNHRSHRSICPTGSRSAPSIVSKKTARVPFQFRSSKTVTEETGCTYSRGHGNRRYAVRSSGDFTDASAAALTEIETHEIGRGRDLRAASTRAASTTISTPTMCAFPPE